MAGWSWAVGKARPEGHNLTSEQAAGLPKGRNGGLEPGRGGDLPDITALRCSFRALCWECLMFQRKTV